MGLMGFPSWRQRLSGGTVFLLGATTILEHQVVGMPTDTGSIITNAMSRSRSCYTILPGIGVRTTDGVAPRTNVMSNYFSVKVCKGWCGHVLNALDLKWTRSHRSGKCLLVSVGRNGMVLSIAGIGFLRGHLHRAFSFAFFEMPALGNQAVTDVGPSVQILISTNQK